MENTPRSTTPPSKGFASLFNAPTDIPAFLVIALGIAIAALMEDLPVRLIGVCIAILGSLAIFILYAQRVKDLSALQEPTKPVKTVSEVQDFKTSVKQETGSKRLVFDDFAESFGVVDDDISSPPITPTAKPSPQAQSTPQTSSQENNKVPISSGNQTLPKRLVFDDFDEAADFDDVQLVTAPEKYTVQAPPPKLPDAPPPVQRPPFTPPTPSSSDSTFSKKVLVFDDSDESASFNNDFQPSIAVGTTALPDSLKKSAPPAPVTPTPEPFTRPEPTVGNYTPPTLDESLLGADFEDDEGGEFRILGKVPTVAVGSSTTNTTFQDELAKKKNEDVEKRPIDEDSTFTKEHELTPPQNNQDLNSQESSNQALGEPITQATVAEAIQDKVSRASKAALHIETIEKEIREISTVSSQVGVERTSDAAAAAQAADVQKFRAEKFSSGNSDASTIAAGQVSTALPEEAVSHRRKKLSVTMDEIAEETPDVVKNEPRREFDFLLQRILMAIRSAMNARTAAYWWYAADRKRLTIEAKISDVSDMMQNRTIPLTETDAVSQIAQTGTPEILSEISTDAELTLLPYYTTPTKTRSFVGVPVFYNNAVVGILTADSTEDDAYDNATVSFLGHFTKLISGLIQSYTEKYDLLQAARTLEAIDTFRQLTLKPERTGEDICTALIRSLMRLVPYSTMGTCIFNDSTQYWYISNMHTKLSDARSILGERVELESSLIGKSITNGRTYRFQNLTPNFVRIAEKESKPTALAFTTIPLVSVSRCYGALFIEETGETRLTKQDIEILETACEYAGTALEQIQLQDYVQSHAQQQAEENERRREITSRLEEEMLSAAIAFVEDTRAAMLRAKDENTALALVLVKLDEYAAFANNIALRDELFKIFSATVRQSAQETDLVGQYVGNVVGVCMQGKTLHEAQMWSERLRRDIASKSLTVNGKQFTVTASIGLVGLMKQASAEELFSHAEQALNLASQATNRVNIFG